MVNDWQELTKITGGAALTVKQVKLISKDIVLAGEFELPPLARLSMEDQIFIIAFVRSHGSIKEMEELFGISYPTVKNRLNRISRQLEFVEVNPPPSRTEVLAQLEMGELSVEDALKELRKK